MNHFGDVKFNAIARVANILGMDIGEEKHNEETWYFLHEDEDSENIIYGPLYNSEPVDLDDIADFMIEDLEKTEPRDVDNFRSMWRDYTDFRDCGDIGAIYELCSVILCADDLDDYGLVDLKEDIQEKCSQAIIDTLGEILEAAKKETGGNG